MDPQACFDRIMSALTEQDVNEYVDAFDDLAKWLARGGFPPVVNAENFGTCRYRVGHSANWQFVEAPRTILSSAPFSSFRHYAIQLCDVAHPEWGFEFVCYAGEKLVARYQLPITDGAMVLRGNTVSSQR